MSRSSGHGPDYDAAMAGARLQWDALSPTMQDALEDASPWPGGRRIFARRPTSTALRSRGLVGKMYACDRSGPLTPMGLLVREAGLAARAEAGL